MKFEPEWYCGIIETPWRRHFGAKTVRLSMRLELT